MENVIGGAKPELRRNTRRDTALSPERIVATAIDILDSEGESALTFRSLASRLETGAGAIYWHVANKDELLRAATNAVVAKVLDEMSGQSAPQEEIRAIALGLFDASEAHPWIGSQLSRESWQLGNTRIFEAIGSKVQGLGVPEESQFDVTSALTNYISGVAAQNAANARNVPEGMDRTTFLTLSAQRWAQLNPAEYPFVRHVLAKLAHHDDRKQFAAGVDLILGGVSLLG